MRLRPVVELFEDKSLESSPNLQLLRGFSTIQSSLMKFAITIDLHPWGHPDDIPRARDWLDARSIPATFFVPTVMLAGGPFKTALLSLKQSIHQIGTHSHEHSLAEVTAIQSTRRQDLRFLEHSQQVFAEFYGDAPLCFRSPAWVRPSGVAYELLSELGYHVDSSATPQRLGLLSSYPFSNPWLAAPRRPTFITGNLLEIPTSSLLVPYGRLAAATFRTWGMRMFSAILLIEARLLKQRVLNLQLHAEDLVPSGPELARPKEPCLRDLLLKKHFGFGFRHWLADENRLRMYQRVSSLLDWLARMKADFVTLEDVFRDYLAKRKNPAQGSPVSPQAIVATRAEHQ